MNDFDGSPQSTQRPFDTPQPGQQTWRWPVLVLAVVTAVAVLLAFQRPVILTSDQVNLALIVLQSLKPQSFANDYAFSDPAIFGYYTPTFRFLTYNLTLASGSFENALALLVAPVASLYLAGMMWLIFRITHRPPVAAGVALASTSLNLRGPLGDFWGNVLVMHNIAPRTLYQATIPFLFGGLLMLLGADRRNYGRRAWGLFGLGMGLAANLHPVSAEATGLVFGSMVLLALLRDDIQLKNVWPALPTLLVGAAPTLAVFLRGTESVPVESYSFTFEQFYAIADIRVQTVWPWHWQRLWLWRRLSLPSITSGLQTGLLVAHAVLSILAGLGLWATRGRTEGDAGRRALWTALGLLQVAAVAFLVLRVGWITLLFAAYVGFRLIHDRLDWLDRRLLETIAFLFGLGIVSLVGQWLWRTFELWPLSLWVTQLPRGMRFVYLPVFIMIGRLAALWLDRRDWAMLLGCLVLVAWPDKLDGRLSFALSATFVGLWLAWPFPARRPVLARAALHGVAGGLLVRLTLDGLGLDGSPLPTLATAVVLSGLTIVAEWWPRWKRRGIPLAGLSALIAMLVVPQPYVESETRAPLGALLPSSVASYAMDVWQAAFPLDRTEHLPDDERDRLTLFEWARTQTAEDSLFYTELIEFRLYAERSITHSWKDLGTAFFLRYPLVDFYERYESLQAAYDDPALLAAAAGRVDADYVVVPVAYDVRLPWPVAFQNGQFTVYHRE